MKQGFNDDSRVDCPKCKSVAKRIFLPVPIIFKGSGFYVTDHRKPSGEQSLAKVPETTKEISVPSTTDSKPSSSS
jgi:predicted nucleic acid-binding Zn ribbon protein